MTREEALNKAINIVRYFEAHFAKSKEAREDAVNIVEALEQELKWIPVSERLTDILIEYIFRVTECKGNESSVEKARNEAFEWFNQLIEMLEENFDIKMVRAEGSDKE